MNIETNKKQSQIKPKSAKVSQNQLNLYGVIFIYEPYMDIWIAYANSEDQRNATAGFDLDYYPYKSKNIKTLIDYIWDNGYLKNRKNAKHSVINKK